MEPELDNTILDPAGLSRLLFQTFLMFIASAFVAAALVSLGEPKLGLLAEVLFIIPALSLVRRGNLSFSRTFRFRRISPRVLAATLLLALPLLVLSDELDRIMALFFPLPDWFTVGDLLTIRSFWDGLLIIGNGVVVAALAEEMLFRGIVQRSLEHMQDVASAIAISAILFSMLHFNIWWMLQITLLGLILGYITWRSGSIWPAVLVHGINNLLSILSAQYTSESMSWYAAETHVRWIWIILALILLAPAFLGFNAACRAQAASKTHNLRKGGDDE